MMNEENDMNEQESQDNECDEFACPIQQFEDAQEGEEPYITHILTTTKGEVIYAYKSLELEEELPNGEVEIVIAIDALNHPEKGDRSIIIIPKSHIDYTQESYDKEIWDELMRAAFCSQCEQMAQYSSSAHTYGIYQ